MTPVGALAFEVYRIANSQTEGRAIIHIAQQQKSFAVQQAMVVTDILSKEKAVPWTCEQVRCSYFHSYIIECIGLYSIPILLNVLVSIPFLYY